LALIWSVLYLGWVAGEIVIAIGTRRRGKAKENQDRGTQLLLWVAIVLSLNAVGFMEALVPTSFRWDAAWLRPLSLILMIFGIGVRAAAIATLGQWFTANVVTQPGQQLQRRGLYSLVRHPSYLGMEMIFLAIGLHSRAWPALIVAVVPPTAAVLNRIRVEETVLVHAFGESYLKYCRATKRLIPGVY
jgi:protein-S-isoprenylcysteine O-methyltransferase Ste14